MIVEKILNNLNGIDLKNRSIDRVTLSHEEMMKPHQKVASEGGRVIGISLPQGEHLHNGDILYMDEEEIVAIDLMEEDVYEIRPKNNIEWARAAFNIGNMHQRAYLYSSCIRVPYDYVLERMLEALGIEYSREKRKLDGIPANIPAAGSHHHHHD
jgi:urease accessory protein